MDTKLTLKLDKEIIEKARTFAKKNKTSLSTLVEDYFISLDKPNSGQAGITPTVKALSGVLKTKGDVDIAALKDDYLLKKYLHD